MKRIFMAVAGLLLSLLVVGQVQAQHYYAVIITTFGPDNFPGLPAAPNGPLLPSGNSALWDDTFLIWQMIDSLGYDSRYVFYDQGSDFSSLDPQYQLPAGQHLTNAAASASNIGAYFQNQLRTQLADDDVLFVWVFGHGDISNGITRLLFANGDIVTPSTFASWFDGVHYKKRIVVMGQCRSGGFIPSLADQKTIVLTACTGSEDARWADDRYPDGGDAWENESIDQGKFYHSEFNYHLLNALKRNTVHYHGPVPSDADNNGGVSIGEAFGYASESESTLETPQLSDIGYNSGNT